MEEIKKKITRNRPTGLTYDRKVLTVEERKELRRIQNKAYYEAKKAKLLAYEMLLAEKQK